MFQHWDWFEDLYPRRQSPGWDEDSDDQEDEEYGRFLSRGYGECSVRSRRQVITAQLVSKYSFTQHNDVDWDERLVVLWCPCSPLNEFAVF